MKSFVNPSQSPPRAKVYQLISEMYDVVVYFTGEREGIYLHDSRDPSFTFVFSKDLISYKDANTWRPFTGLITLEVNNGV